MGLVMDSTAWVNMFSAQLPRELHPFANASCTCDARERGIPRNERIAALQGIEARDPGADATLMEHLALAGQWFQADVRAVAQYCVCPDAIRIRARGGDR